MSTTPLKENIEKKIDKASEEIATADAYRREAVAEVAEAATEKAAAASKNIEETLVDPETDKIGRGLKIFAFLSLVASVVTLVIFVLSGLAVIYLATKGEATFSDGISTQALILNAVAAVVSAFQAALFVVFSVRILRNKRRNAALITTVMLGVAVVDLVLSLMTTGIYTWSTLVAFAVLLFLIVMHSFLDPQLADERRLQKKLFDMEERADAEAGMLGRDRTGKGYIKLNFFNLFWILMVACFLGWCFEMLVCPILNGRIEDRTGMLFGPLSPIYGIGATLMTIALNRFYNKNPLAVFAIAACIGGAFEFFVSWFFENAFGILAWDYSGEPFNLAGRTDLMHAVCWGCLGLVFVRFLLPFLLDTINKIPWNWRYGVTSVVAALMLANALMTMTAFDCWFQRVSGVQPDTPVAQFFAEHYDNDFMKARFPTMSIDPNRVTHG